MSVTVVYRSAADMNKAEYWYEEGPKMQERAINAEAEVAKLRAVLHEIYPAIAGRASQLLSAGEEKAAMQWGQMARLVYDAEGSGDR